MIDVKQYFIFKLINEIFEIKLYSFSFLFFSIFISIF